MGTSQLVGLSKSVIYCTQLIFRAYPASKVSLSQRRSLTLCERSCLCQCCDYRVLILLRHIKRLAHGIPEDKVSYGGFLNQVAFPLTMFWTVVGLFTRGNLPGNEAWCCNRGV
jgi:hypothetical protein